MMLSLVVHYKNKYPKAKVEHSESSLTVTDQDGNLLVAIRAGGGGELVDMGKTLGASDQHDLSPIPKNARLYKITKDNRIAKDEKYDDRKASAYRLAEKDGKVPSIAELKAEGYNFDGETAILPEKKAEEVPQQPQA